MSDKKIFVAGHNGLVGSAVVRKLSKITDQIITVDKSKLNLRNQHDVYKWFEQNKPNHVYLCAAKVGGIVGNSTYPAEFIYDNIIIQSNVINAAWETGVEKLLFLGSTCVYPKMCKQPIKEEYLLTSALEPSNEWYAIAKIAGVKMCEAYRKQYGCNFISAMPCNLYGIGDNYHPENSHVIPGMINRFHNAKKKGDQTVMCWGDGSPQREFLYVDDLANALVMLMDKYNESQPINIGPGTDITIKYLAETVAEIVGYTGNIIWGESTLNGTTRKVTDNTKILSLGWKPTVNLETGITISYNDFLKRYE
jgi:GDP-L-fucose synthase